MKKYLIVLTNIINFVHSTHASSEGSHLVHESSNNNGSGSGGSAVSHSLGDTGLKAMVITEDVIHKGDGKAYTSIPVLSNALQTGTAKSVDQQIAEMNVGALESEKESLSARHEAAALKEKIKRLEAKEKRAKANLLAKQKAEIDRILHSPKEELVKDVMPIIAVTPHSMGFVEHDKLELQRLNDIRMAALNEGEMQKRNALLHERPNNESPMESLASDPLLLKKFYENAPVNKTSAVVDPTKGKFSIINDNSRKGSTGDVHTHSTGSGSSSSGKSSSSGSKLRSSRSGSGNSGSGRSGSGNSGSGNSDGSSSGPYSTSSNFDDYPTTSEKSGLSRLSGLFGRSSSSGGWF